MTKVKTTRMHLLTRKNPLDERTLCRDIEAGLKRFWDNRRGNKPLRHNARSK